MRRTLEILNELEREGVFSRYAIGGAMAATFYTEPVLTFGLDVFILLQSESGGGLVSLDEGGARGARGQSLQSILAESPEVEGSKVR